MPCLFFCSRSLVWRVLQGIQRMALFLLVHRLILPSLSFLCSSLWRWVHAYIPWLSGLTTYHWVITLAFVWRKWSRKGRTLGFGWELDNTVQLWGIIIITITSPSHQQQPLLGKGVIGESLLQYLGQAQGISFVQRRRRGWLASSTRVWETGEVPYDTHYPIFLLSFVIAS